MRKSWSVLILAAGHVASELRAVVNGPSDIMSRIGREFNTLMWVEFFDGFYKSYYAILR